MPWMDVQIEVEGQPSVENIVNTEHIVRVGPRHPSGSYIRLADGTAINVTDPFEEIKHVVLKAQSQ